MSLDSLILGYLVCLLAGLVAVAFYYEQRRRKFTPQRDPDNVYRCEKCGFVYTDDPDVDRSRCPHCGQMNDVINF